MTDGSTINLHGTLNEPLTANNDYAIGFYVTWNSSDSTFTIDEIDVVEDVIEF